MKFLNYKTILSIIIPLFAVFFSILVFYSSGVKVCHPVSLELFPKEAIQKDSIGISGTSPFGNKLSFKEDSPGGLCYEHYRFYKRIEIINYSKHISVIDTLVLSGQDVKTPVYFTNLKLHPGEEFELTSRMKAIPLSEKISCFFKMGYVKNLLIRIFIILISVLLVRLLVKYRKVINKFILETALVLKRLIKLLFGLENCLVFAVISIVRSVINKGKEIGRRLFKLCLSMKSGIIKILSTIIRIIREILNLTGRGGDLLFSYFRSFLFWFLRDYNALLLLIIGVFVPYLFNVFLYIFSYNGNLEGIAGILSHHVQRFLLFGKLYTDPESIPFFPLYYAPLYFYLNAFLVKLIGINPWTDIITINAIGSIISLLAMFGISIIIYFLLKKKLNVNKKLALISGMLIFIFALFYNFTYRPDSLKVLFEVLCIYLIIDYLRTGRERNFLLAAIFILLAVFTKQDAIYFFLPLLYVLLKQKKYKALIIYSTILICIAGILIAALMITNDRFIINIMGIKMSDGITFWYLTNVIFQYIIKTLPLILIGFYLSIKLFKEKENEQGQFLSVLFWVSLLFPLLFSFKNGASINYFFEFQMMAVLIIIYYYSKHSFSFNKVHNFIIFLLVVVYTIFLCLEKNKIRFNSMITDYSVPVYNKKTNDNNKLKYKKALMTAEYVRNEIKPKKGEYIATYNLIFNYFLPEFVINIEHKQYYYRYLKFLTGVDFPLTVCSYDVSRLEQLIDSGGLKYIILNNDEPGKKFMKKEMRSYILFKTIEGYMIYKWAPDRSKCCK